MRDRWVPEMENHVEKAKDGQSASLKILAWGFQSQGFSIPKGTFNRPNSEIDWDLISSQLDQAKTAHRALWRKAKQEKDKTLQQLGWDQPETLAQIKSAQFNRVLHEWTTQKNALTSGVALDKAHIVNTKDALYSRAEWPGMGAFYSAQSWMGGMVPKRYANWTVLWSSTFILMIALAWGKSGFTRARPQRT